MARPFKVGDKVRLTKDRISQHSPDAIKEYLGPMVVISVANNGQIVTTAPDCIWYSTSLEHCWGIHDIKRVITGNTRRTTRNKKGTKAI